MKAPKIFYFCYRHNRPTGGQKHTYRHVDILNQHGFDATVFHPDPEFRLNWFKNDTRVITYADFLRQVDPARDVVVLPEDLGLRINNFPGRKVIFNKNLFYGFLCYGVEGPSQYPYHSPEVVAAFTVSEHNKAHLQLAYPDLPVERVHIEIDSAIFRYRTLVEKKPQIACIPKSSEYLMSLYHMLRSRTASGLNNGQAFEWVFIENKSEAQTAAILQDSLIFIFLSVAEGMGRMPLEAMACGCLLTAFAHGPLAEILPPCARFECGDLISVVTYIENIMNSFPQEIQRWSACVTAGRDIAKSYSLERQEASVLQAWERVLRACDGAK
jgi:glycosyltransferase involved in cell wall biosynthesis